MVLRKTAAGLERRAEDGSWHAVEPTTVAPDIRSEVDTLLANDTNGTAHGTTDPESESAPAEEAPAVLDIAVPGLLSTDTRRGVAGQSRLRKLQDSARKNTKPGSGGRGSKVMARAPRTAKHILVPATASEVSGPDAQKKVLDGSRRIVVRETPSLLESRPKWVQDLFEAHFRSELALTLRHLPMGKSGKNRMKLSRADYAIGWLVMFDKAREDPGILRLR